MFVWCLVSSPPTAGGKVNSDSPFSTHSSRLFWCDKLSIGLPLGFFSCLFFEILHMYALSHSGFQQLREWQKTRTDGTGQFAAFARDCLGMTALYSVRMFILSLIHIIRYITGPRTHFPPLDFKTTSIIDVRSREQTELASLLWISFCARFSWSDNSIFC